MQSYSVTPANATDFEATLASSDSRVRLLRHYPWWFRQRDGKDGSLRLSVWNELEDQGFSYQASLGERRLAVARSEQLTQRYFSEFDNAYGLEKLSKTDRFLGEDCTWYDLMPNTADAGRTQCLTSDGIPLQDHFSSGWGAGEYFETLEFKRRIVSLEEMRPPAEYMTPAAWGFQARDER